MAAGDLTASTPVFCATEAAIKAEIDGLNLAATTDTVHVVPWNNGAMVFKVERAAA